MRSGAARVAWAVVIAVAVALGCGGGAPGADVAPAPVTVVAVDVSPPSADVPPGGMQSFTATLRLSNGTTRNPVANEVTWASSMTSVATIDASGVATVARDAVGITTIIASVGRGAAEIRGTAVLTATHGDGIEAIVIAPTTTTIPAGQTQQFDALGLFSGGVTSDVTLAVQWSSSAPAVATIDATGAARGVAVGTTMIRASVGPVTSNVAVLTVAAPRLVSIALSPPAATLLAGSMGVVALVATGSFSDGTARDVTATATWTSSAPAIATVSTTLAPRGQVYPSVTMPGTATITAALDGVVSSPAVITVLPNPGIRSIAVTPSPADLGCGDSRPLTATAIYLDGRTADVTAMATWASTATGVVTVDASTGLAHGECGGGASVTVTIGAVVGTGTVDVQCNGPSAIELAPAVVTLPVGARQAFTAVGTYPGGDTRPLVARLRWSSVDPGVATVDASGVATAIAPGTTTLRAQSCPTVGAATLVVPAVDPVTLTIPTTDLALPVGATQQLRAIATYSDGTTYDLTSGASWFSELSAVATVSAGGLVTGIALGGPIAVRAVIPGPGGPVVAAVAVTVSSATLARIDLAPAATATVQRGYTLAFAATGTYSDARARDLTHDPRLAWTTSDGLTATISSAPGPGRGIATAFTAGTTRIGATYSDGVHPAVTATPTTLTVGAALLTRVVVTSGTGSVPIGFTEPFTATGYFSDGTTRELTDDLALSWSTADPAIATISNAPVPRRGLATAVAPGTVVVRGTVGVGASAVAGSLDLVVTPARLTSLALSPATADLPLGSPGISLTVTGTFGDGTTRELTGDPLIVYATSDPRRVRFDRNVASTVAGASPATGVTLTATRGAIRGTATVNVTAAPTP